VIDIPINKALVAVERKGQRCPECGNKYKLNYDYGYSAVYKEECECGFSSKELEWKKEV